jgi:hypothetical protein
MSSNNLPYSIQTLIDLREQYIDIEKALVADPENHGPYVLGRHVIQVSPHGITITTATPIEIPCKTPDKTLKDLDVTTPGKRLHP